MNIETGFTFRHLTWRGRWYYIADYFWRAVLCVFGWIPERILPWCHTKVFTPSLQAYRNWECRNGHIEPVKMITIVGLYSPKRTAIIERKIGCSHCGAVTHKTWKGRMTEERRRLYANLYIPTE